MDRMVHAPYRLVQERARGSCQAWPTAWTSGSAPSRASIGAPEDADPRSPEEVLATLLRRHCGPRALAVSRSLAGIIGTANGEAGRGGETSEQELFATFPGAICASSRPSCPVAGRFGSYAEPTAGLEPATPSLRGSTPTNSDF